MSSSTGRIHATPRNSSTRAGLWVRIGIAALVLLAASCGGEEAAFAPSPAVVGPSPAPVLPTTEPPAPTAAPSPALTAPATPAGTITVKVADHANLGTILVDGSGRTLYLFSADERNQSNCAGSCTEAWPPLLTVHDVSAGEDVTVDALGSLIRDDGSNQVTYNGWPLYYFAGDETPGDAKGQNNGDVWFVVSVYGGPKQNNAAVKTSEHPELGTVLTDASGRTLYLFTVDERDKSNCLGGCALAWPPLLTVGDPTADEAIADERLSSVTRGDGSVQVTYNGWPLYYYAPDRGPGEARGQNSGSLWYVVSTYGGPIQTNAMVRTYDLPGLGTILTEASGRTVYLFTMDERNKSSCSGGCALAWPPLLTVGAPTAEEGVATRRLGSITREDGYAQVTYDGWPLYYFAPDEKPGDAMGQSVGDVWFVVSSAGEAVTITSPTPTAMDHATPVPTATALAVEPSPTPMPTSIVTAGPTVSPTPTSSPISSPPSATREVATIEDYAASQFFPATVIVIKDVPVNLSMTRLHSEHVNRFTIEPFVFSRPFAPPGAVGRVQFTPDQSGQFKMRNVGHFFEGDFIVAESVEDAKTLIAQRGIQEFSLIHNMEAGWIISDRIVVQKDVPVKVYNTSLMGNGRVSIDPFYRPQGVNVEERKITTFEFIPDVAGEFAIRNGDEVAIGTLVVE